VSSSSSLFISHELFTTKELIKLDVFYFPVAEVNVDSIRSRLKAC